MRESKALAIVFTILAAVIAAVPAHAAHPLITDDTGTQGTGRFQLEVNGEYGSDRETSLGIETMERSIEAAAALSYGVIDSLDVVIGVPYLRVDGRETDSTIPVRTSEKGFSDISAELKWRFYENTGLSFALKPGVGVPTGSERKGLGTGKYEWSAYLIATQS